MVVALGPIEPGEQPAFFELRQNGRGPAQGRVGRRRAAARKDLKRVVIGQKRHAQLPQVVGALPASGTLARGLDRRKQDRHEQADDRDHHQQLDEREPATSEAAEGAGETNHGALCAHTIGARRLPTVGAGKRAVCAHQLTHVGHSRHASSD
jgi:hypothetical protein